MDRPTGTRAISESHVMSTCIKVMRSQLPCEEDPAAPSSASESPLWTIGELTIRVTRRGRARTGEEVP